MTYTSRYRSDDFQPEEEEVHETLHTAGYREVLDSYVWVPIKILYRVYRDTRMQHKAELANRLTVRQFGVAFNRVYPNTESVKRSCGGKEVIGRACFTGPNEIRTMNEEESWLVSHENRTVSS